MNFLFTGNNVGDGEKMSNSQVVKTLVKHIKAGIKEVKADPVKWKSSNQSLYGLGATLPEHAMNEAIRHVMSILNDLPNRK